MKERISNAVFAIWMVVLTGFGSSAGAGEVLRVIHEGDQLNFELAHDGSKETWILQYSPDGKDWEDLVFLDRVVGESKSGVKIDVKAMTGVELEAAFFRGAKLAGDDAFYREFLASRVLWTTNGPSSYTYELTWNWSFFTWHGVVTVVEGEVTGTETISSFPEEIGPLDELTIEEWFEKIESARAREVDTLEVTWDAAFGFPASGFIDVSILIADEEQSWTMKNLTPLE